ncbi:GIY-YIG nuclease family protein [Vreelandella titanicae]|uniref:GIY-YIG nuclease family protein n=1 Tax=Vreelandella titanicae TaxID=664683 RepID=UPI003CFE5C5E
MQKPNIYKFPNQTDPKRFFAKAGWVYVLGNGHMPDLYKVGRTTGSIKVRMSQLFTTGVPMPFDCMFAEWFADCSAAEEFIHHYLEEWRIEFNREFFGADLTTIQHAFMSYSAIGESIPDFVVDLYTMRRRQAESNERVNGVLVARNKRTSACMEAPF